MCGGAESTGFLLGHQWTGHPSPGSHQSESRVIQQHECILLIATIWKFCAAWPLPAFHCCMERPRDKVKMLYYIAGNFGEVLIGNLVNWVRFTKLKTCQFKPNACMPMTPSIQITKFKFCQYELKAISPNLMPSKYPPYTYLQMLQRTCIMSASAVY